MKLTITNVSIILGCAVSILVIAGATITGLKFYFTAVGSKEWAPVIIKDEVDKIDDRLATVEANSNEIVKELEELTTYHQERDKITQKTTEELIQRFSSIETINSQILQKLNERLNNR